MKRYNFSLFLLVALILFSGSAWCAGYEIQEQSAKGLGQAFAGRTTGFGDGSEVFYNPASMANLKGDVFTAGVSVLVTGAKFRNDNSSLVPGIGGAAITGGDGGDGGSTELVPNIYYVGEVNGRMKAGLGINSPFGLRSKYDDGWVGRYHALKSELTTINIIPAVSYQFLDNVAIGLAISNMYLDAELTNNIDFGSIGVAALGLPTAATLGLTPQNADGFGRLEGDDWAHGVTVGAVIDVTSDTSLGLAYRSKMNATLDGDAEFILPSNAVPLTVGGLFTNSSANADVVVPENFSMGITHSFNERLELSVEGSWTRWTRFKEIRIDYPGSIPDTVMPENWENTWRVGAGLSYEVNPSWVLRVGTAWDETPVSSAEFRTPRIPDENRIWATIGSSWLITDSVTLDLGYGHLFIEDAPSENLTATGAILKGDYDLSIDLLSLGLTWKL